MKLFVWLSFVVDFFGIFFIVSFAFYQPTNAEYQQYFDNFFTFCLYEMICCVLPFAVIGSIGIHIYWDAKLFSEKFMRYNSYPYFLFPFVVIMITLLWLIGLFLTLLIMNIFCVLWPSFAIIGMSTSSRLPYQKEPKQFYLDIIPWIKDEARAIKDIDGKKILLTTEEDRLRRLCVFNKIVLEQHPKTHYDYDAPWQNYRDGTLLRYLAKKQKDRFEGVSYRDLRANCGQEKFKYETKWRNVRRQPYLLGYFFFEIYATLLMEFRYKREEAAYQSERCFLGIGVGTLYWLTFMAGPLYLLSRAFNVFLPPCIVLYLGGEGINLFVDLDIFQVVMLSSYAALLTVWFIMASLVLRDLFILWHILPSCGYLKAGKKDGNDKVTKMIKDTYFEMTAYPIILSILSNRFGPDISCVILDYFDSIEPEMQQRSK